MTYQLPKGGLMALDWGKRKVGYATVDELGLVVTPRGHFERKNPARTWTLSASDETQIAELLESFEPGGLVLGLPRLPGGRESEASQGARALAHVLREKLGLGVDLVDESLSSWEAQSRRQGRKFDEDAEAAATLLQDFLRQKNGGTQGFVSRSFLLILFVLALIIGAAGFRQWSHFAWEKISNETGAFIVDVPPQSTFFSVRNSLANQGIEVDRFLFRFWIWSHRANHRLHVGEYEIQKSWSRKRALEEILAGHVLLHKLTVKEGFNLWDIEKEFQAVGFRKATPVNPDFMQLVHDPRLMARMEVPHPSNPAAKLSLEGFLFPETYSYQKYDSSTELVHAMLMEFERRALPILKEHPWGNTAEGRYRLLTLASIVEKESGQATEQPLIASVFWNRLQKKMRLQSDPTTIYGLLPNFDGNLRRIHLTTASLYNTYTLSELPVGPICNPGETALRAVVHPATTTNLFFVARGDGSHAFSADLKTHESYVRRFQLHLPDPAPQAAPTQKRSPARKGKGKKV